MKIIVIALSLLGLNGCIVSTAVREIGLKREFLVPDNASYADNTLRVQYHVDGSDSLHRLQTIIGVDYKSVLDYNDIIQDVTRDLETVLIGTVSPDAGSTESVVDSFNGMPVDISKIKKIGIMRNWYEDKHYPCQALLLVSIPVDIIATPIYVIMMINLIGH